MNFSLKTSHIKWN